MRQFPQSEIGAFFYINWRQTTLTPRKINTIISVVPFNRNINRKGGRAMAKKPGQQKKVADKTATRKTAKKMKIDEPFENVAKLRRRIEKRYGKKKGKRLVERQINETIEKMVYIMPWDIEKAK